MSQNKLRNDFPLLVNNPVAWLDNASTTQKPQVVLDAMSEFYAHDNANVHRGLYALSARATARYEDVRTHTQAWLNAVSTEEIIFTSGTTASINLLAVSLGKLQLHPDDVILLSPSEHHSNIVPWQLAAQRFGAKLEWFDLSPDGTINLDTVSNKFHDRVKIVSIAQISNASGAINPIKDIIALAHARGIPVIIDAAQSAPHWGLDVQTLDCDFLVFSSHKLCGPTGVGILYGKKRWLEQMEPWQGGGDMIRSVSLNESTWNELPYKFEAGTPNIAGVIGFGAALDYLCIHGINKLQRDTDMVYQYLLDQLATLNYVTIFGPSVRNQRSSIASFLVEGVHPHDVAQVLDGHNVAVRAGHHCAQPLMQHWGVPATTRASVYFYNTTEDVDRLITGLKDVYNKFRPHTPTLSPFRKEGVVSLSNKERDQG